jgi:hypothetical protein
MIRWMQLEICRQHAELRDGLLCSEQLEGESYCKKSHTWLSYHIS